MTEPSLTQQVLDRCREALFTGILRVRTRQAAGEVWFLSGILERVRFGVSTGNEAMSRLLAATDPRIDVVACLPNPAGGFDKGHPMEGELGTTLPVDLMRFCEMHALTCAIHLRAGDSSGEAIYRLGELLSVRSDEGSDRGVAEMLEWSEGQFRFTLPLIDLPTRAPDARPSVPPPEPAEEPALAETGAWRTAANEALKRKVVEVEAKRIAEEKRHADEATTAEPAVAAEELRADEATTAEPAVAAEELRADEATTAEPAIAEEELRADEAPTAEPAIAEEELRADEAPTAEPAIAEEELRGAVEAPAFSILVSVQRVTTEYAHISVPVTSAMIESGPEADGTYRVSSEALFAEAERLAREPNVAWQPDGEPRVDIHPMQTPPIDLPS